LTTIAKAIRDIPILTKVAILIVIGYVIVAMFAPLIAPYGETVVVGPTFDMPSSAHPLGTDNLGRDMLSRLIFGARNMVALALATNILAFLIGGLLGMLAAVVGGWLDQVLGRIMDAAMGVPQLILALLLIAILGNSLIVLICIIAILDSTRIFRLTRAVSMNIVALDFVEAAQLRGEGVIWCILHEVLPNITVPLLAEFGIRFCYVFLFISGLGFLGVGLQPPAADWGSMVRDSATLITYGVFAPLYPAVAIAILTVSVNFVVDWVLRRNNKATA
jgi:peptide/nickel transport system permease protein